MGDRTNSVCKTKGVFYMERYDITQKVTFKKGTYQLNKDANFNFQLNRVIMWDGGDAEEVAGVSQGIKTSSDWVSAMERLAEKAHAEGRTANEIAYLRMSEFFIYDTDPKKQQRYRQAAELFYEYYGDYFDKGNVVRHEVPYNGGSLPVMVTKAQGESRGAILLHGGNDSYFEELFFPMLYLAENGFDVYLFEGPGQGGVLRVQNMKFTHKWEKPTKVVLDCFGLDDVTIMGASLGGYLAPRAAAFDKRIKRVVGWSIFPDLFRRSYLRPPEAHARHHRLHVQNGTHRAAEQAVHLHDGKGGDSQVEPSARNVRLRRENALRVRTEDTPLHAEKHSRQDRSGRADLRRKAGSFHHAVPVPRGVRSAAKRTLSDPALADRQAGRGSALQRWQFKAGARFDHQVDRMLRGVSVKQIKSPLKARIQMCLLRGGISFIAPMSVEHLSPLSTVRTPVCFP